MAKYFFEPTPDKKGKLNAKCTVGQLQEELPQFPPQSSSLLLFFEWWFLQQSFLLALPALSFLQQDFSVLSVFVPQA